MPEVMMGEMPSLKLSGMGPWDHGARIGLADSYLLHGRSQFQNAEKKLLVFNLHRHVYL